MAQVHIANGTHQNQHFFYRVVEAQTLRKIEIPAGRQQKFPEDFVEGHQLDSLIKQLERFGAVPASEVSHIEKPRALVYSIDRKPISVGKIDEAREKDEAARQEVSAQQTENAGLTLLATAAQRGNPEAIKTTSLEVTQLNDQGEDPKRGGVDVEVSVSTNASAGKKQMGKRRG